MAYRKEKQDIAIGGTFFQPNYHMVSADPAKSDLWHKVIGKSGRVWLYQPDGSRVWVDGERTKHSHFKGCGGRTITFSLADGGTIDLEGPWCSNADACFEDTGIDVRDNFVTWGCIGTERVFDENSGRLGIGNVIWFDPEPVKGKFDRCDMIAWALHLQNPDLKLQHYWESDGGSSLGAVSEPFRLRTARGTVARDLVLAEAFALTVS